jgi:hypothetical protein
MGVIDLTMAWRDLHLTLDDIDDPDVLVQFIGQLWKQTPRGDVSSQLDFLARFVVVRPNARPAVSRPAGGVVPIQVAVAAARAMAYILGSRTEASREQWPTLRALGLYEMDQEDIFVEGRKFLIICDYLARLGVTRPDLAGSYLVDFLIATGHGEFYGVDVVLWRRELRNAVHHCCTIGERVIQPLVAACHPLDGDIATVVTAAVAERHYIAAREHLIALSNKDISADLRRSLVELMRGYDRSVGTSTFPEILTRT